jgi:hypothetical protein
MRGARNLALLVGHKEFPPGTVRPDA